MAVNKKMRAKRCPYCGKRISYFSVFSSRKKGEMTCSRCGKNSKVYVSKKIMLVFAVFVLLSLSVMAVCIFAKMLYNPFTIALVAIPLLIFMLLTPMFVSYEPFKKYKPSMEARKAGIEYADNLTADEFEIKENVSVFPPIKKSNIYEPEPSEEESDFKINSDVFNKIKAERNAARIDLNNDNGTSETKAVPTVKNSNYVSVIKNVSENHASTGAGLKKIHSETERNSVRRTRHYIPNQNDEDNEPQKNERHRPDSNRYSANRRF